MLVRFHNSFKRAYKKRVVVLKLVIFKNNPNHPILRDYSLKGKKIGLRTFWVSGNIRIVYLPISEDEVLLLDYWNA